MNTKTDKKINRYIVLFAIFYLLVMTGLVFQYKAASIRLILPLLLATITVYFVYTIVSGFKFLRRK